MGACFFCGKPATSEHGDICSMHERKITAKHAEILRTRHPDVVRIEPVYISGKLEDTTLVVPQGPIKMGQPPMNEAKRYPTVR